ncbi:glycogen synthase [Desulfosarcina ovata]|uniref:starch synthase n=1 Tax=Desulfosarcina ovata subsp. ovata TaxID=2752305 RepID=A0A5K8AF93_9BACT|nr:glycogen/starch synthase [Desulfosarcina ovata]BBO91315.1 glycogen synthase [Desulfosarcina ovata subsp. ovata]
MPKAKRNPRVLIVTPEVTYLPDRMGNFSRYLTAKAGGLADVSAALVSALFNEGADVYVALPDYRSIFHDRLAPFLEREQWAIRNVMPDDRVHLAEDRAFFYLNRVYSAYGGENTKLSLAFQREVINNIVPRVRPDLIHCNDWMTGLIPAMSRQMGVPCLFTIHNIHTVKATLAHIEDRGIDAAYFWQHLFYEKFSASYEEAWESNPVDFLASGVFAAHFVNTVSPRFLEEIVEGRHGFVEGPIRQELTNKFYAGCGTGILNAPDPSFNPAKDPEIHRNYTAQDHSAGKRENKRHLQEVLGLIPDEQAPLFFWPSRLDPIQKGCQLLAEAFYGIISDHWDMNLQVVFVANGDYQQIFRDIVNHHGFQQRVAVCDFSEKMEHLAYAAADFILMPSLFEPCGLPQMIAPIYGALPVAHDTGGIHDTIVHLDAGRDTGNGFLFNTYDSAGLYWAITQAVAFFKLPEAEKTRQITRIMQQSAATFNHANTARRYIDLYEKMLERPLIN